VSSADNMLRNDRIQEAHGIGHRPDRHDAGPTLCPHGTITTVANTSRTNRTAAPSGVPMKAFGVPSPTSWYGLAHRSTYAISASSNAPSIRSHAADGRSAPSI